jgi:hypothetical protein
MPNFLLTINEYHILEITEMDDETDAPQTLVNIDKYGSGNMALHAPDAARAEQFSQAHLSIHKNWDNPAFLPVSLN